MARVVVTARARTDLERLIRTRNLPATTRTRVAASLRPLAEHPFLGARVGQPDVGYRYRLGPWPWMLLLYWFDAERDLVIVISIEDARSATAVTHEG